MLIRAREFTRLSCFVAPFVDRASVQILNLNPRLIFRTRDSVTVWSSVTTAKTRGRKFCSENFSSNKTNETLRVNAFSVLSDGVVPTGEFSLIRMPSPSYRFVTQRNMSSFPPRIALYVSRKYDEYLFVKIETTLIPEMNLLG